jgi:hypothetical protein
MAEPWIRVHANVSAKPVVWRAVEALGISRAEAVGLLVSFWGSVSQHTTNGAVSHLSDAQLEDWAGWSRKRGKFAAWLRVAHVDSDGRVNEWDEYAGHLEEQRRQARDRKRKSRGRHSDSAVTSSPTKRDETRRDEERDVVEDSAPAVEVLPDPELTALFLTICANRGITERWGEQPSPLVPSNALGLVEDLKASGVGAEVARLSIYRQCREMRHPRPPKSINYFRGGIIADWEAETTRHAMQVSGERAPPFVADANTAHGVRPAIGQRAHDLTLAALRDYP